MRYRIIKFVYVAIDAFCIYFAIYGSCLLRQKMVDFHLSFPYLLVDSLNPYRFLFLFWILVTIFFLNANNLYQTRREVLEGIEIWLVAKSVFLSSLVTVLMIYSLKMQGFPRTVFMNTVFGMVILLSVWRVIKRFFVEYLVIRGYNNFNVLIVGAGKIGMALAEEVERRPSLGIRVAGFLDDFKSAETEGKKHKVLGKICEFPEVARKEFINKIFITVHHDSSVFLNLLEQARQMGVAVRVVPQGFELSSGEFFRYNIGFIPILEYVEEQSFRKQAGKRIFDFITSLITILLLWPVLIVIAILIKCDSRGPVFYVSRRYGRQGRIFPMLKFRSMVREADKLYHDIRCHNEADGPIFKIKNDPRITKFGILLRKYSLDELPQIFNVLAGDMSLVGPRPFPIDQIEKEDLRQLKRLEVRPGMTGLWQIRGRSDISFSRLVKWDIWYINNWSFWLDLNILLQTVPVVFKGRGAY